MRDIIPGWSDTTPDIQNRKAPVVVGGTMFFSALEPSTGYELWKTDGTTAGTKLIKDIVPGWGSSTITKPVVYKNVLYFGGAANGNRTDIELWKSDGTANGTARLLDIRPGAEGSEPAEFTVSGNNRATMARSSASTITTCATPERSRTSTNATLANCRW